jgi:type II secretory pathway pseudopilin PulG
MDMRRALVGITLAALLVPSGASASARSQQRCATRGLTISANSQVRVYRTGPVDDRTYTGCVLKTGKSTVLAFEGGGGSHEWGRFFRLSGPLVAFVDQRCTGSDCSYDARTVDLRTRRSIRRVLNQFGDVLDLRIARSGSFALLLYFGRPEEAVAKIEADGVHDLDYGPDMDERSLAIGGSHIYWTRAGEVHSASIR